MFKQHLDWYYVYGGTLMKQFSIVSRNSEAQCYMHSGVCSMLKSHPALDCITHVEKVGGNQN